MSLCRIITLKKDFSLGHHMSTLLEIEAVPKELRLTGPVNWSQMPYPMAAIKDQNIFACNLLDHDVVVSFSLIIVDDMEKKPLFINRSESHALLLLGEIIEGIFEIMKVQNLRLMSVKPDQETSRLMIDFVVSRRATTYFMMGSSMCFKVALDSMLFMRGLNACDPQTKIHGGMPTKDQGVLAIFQHVMQQTL